MCAAPKQSLDIKLSTAQKKLNTLLRDLSMPRIWRWSKWLPSASKYEYVPPNYSIDILDKLLKNAVESDSKFLPFFIIFITRCHQRGLKKAKHNNFGAAYGEKVA